MGGERLCLDDAERMWLNALKMGGGAQTAQCECGHFIRIMKSRSLLEQKESWKNCDCTSGYGKICHLKFRDVQSYQDQSPQ